MDIIHISSYKFIHLTELQKLQSELKALGSRLNLKGTILLGKEGINSNVCGTTTELDAFKKALTEFPEFNDLVFKTSYCETLPFQKWVVKIKNEIVTSGDLTIEVDQTLNNKITPTTLKEWFEKGIEFDLIDTRNDYEWEIGTFQNAVKLPLKHFKNFAQIMSHVENLKHNGKPKVICCTGGIRCEKAFPIMEKLGFTDVLQLEGGILNYFQQCGGQYYDGECFVFDDRVALDHQLQETSTRLCMACHKPVKNGIEHSCSTYEAIQNAL